MTRKEQKERQQGYYRMIQEDVDRRALESFRRPLYHMKEMTVDEYLLKKQGSKNIITEMGRG